MSEITLVKEILAVIGSRNDVRVWRNNTGTLIDSLGRPVKFGLVGSADILGIIAPQGRFLAIECKTRTGKQSDQQRNFQKMIEAMGGIYILARSLEDVKW
jgi:hypothetical protein